MCMYNFCSGRMCEGRDRIPLVYRAASLVKESTPDSSRDPRVKELGKVLDRELNLNT